MNALKLFIYYLLPKPEIKEYPVESGLKFSYIKGIKRFVQVDVGNGLQYLDLADVKDNVQDYNMSLEDYILTIDHTTVLLLDELPNQTGYWKYTSWADGGYTPLVHRLSDHPIDKDGTDDLLLYKEGYDMRNLSDRALVTCNGLLHRVGNSPYGEHILIYDAHDIMKASNQGGGIIYAPQGSQILTLGMNFNRTRIVGDDVRYQVQSSDFLNHTLSLGTHHMELVIAGVMQTELTWAYLPDDKVIKLAMDDIDLTGIVDRFGYILFPGHFRYGDEPQASELAIMREKIFYHPLTYVVLVRTPEFTHVDIPVTEMSCKGRYKVRGDANYPMVDSKGFLIDYNLDRHEGGYSYITPYTKGIQTKDDTSATPVVDATGSTLDMSTVPLSIAYRAFRQ